MRTIETIINDLSGLVKNKVAISTEHWLEAAQYLNVLIGNETDKMAELEMQVAQKRVEFIQEGDSVAKADAKIEATELYCDMRKQKAKIKQVEEFIRIAKKTAQIKSDEMRHNL